MCQPSHQSLRRFARDATPARFPGFREDSGLGISDPKPRDLPDSLFGDLPEQIA